MSIYKLIRNISATFLFAVILQISYAQQDNLNKQAVSETDEILNIVDPSTIIGTEVLLKDLGLRDNGY